MRSFLLSAGSKETIFENNGIYIMSFVLCSHVDFLLAQELYDL